MTPEIHVADAAGLAGILARLLVDEAARAQAERGMFALALPGGSIATAFFPVLARAPCDWSRVAFFWGDERAVPPAHPESNYAVARSLWLEPAGVPARSIHRMPADHPDMEKAARSYEDALVRMLGSPPRLDVALLGVGPDGHVCSLFPGHPLLREEARYVAAIGDAPKPPPRRLTLTLPALAAAAVTVVAALGEAKAAVLREALEDPDSPLPVALALRRARRAVVVLDPPAAGPLGGRARGGS
jgi:6-phosphogluconolactonase